MRYFILVVSMILVLSATAYSGWESPVVISAGTDDWYYPQVAVEGSYVHVVWRDGGASLLKYRRSTDCGGTWDTIMTLASGTVNSPHVAAQGLSVHVVWRGYEGETGTILYRRSTDGGASFGSQVTLGTGNDRGFEPDVAAYGNYVYVTWIRHDPDYDVLFRRSTDNGVNWGTVTAITSDGGTEEEQCTRIAASGSYVYIVWLEDWPGYGTYGYCERSSNNGVNWSIQTPYTALLNAFDYLSISASDSNVYYDRNDTSQTQGPVQKVSTSWGWPWSGNIYLGSGVDQGPEVDASSAYPGNGCNVYIRNNNLYVSTGAGTETQIGTASGSSPSADIGANWNSDMHVVCSSRVPPYKIYYYRYWKYLRGDTNGDGIVNSADVVYLINFLFKSGSAPNPLWVGDCNADGVANSADVVYLINFLFKSGPPPVCG